MIPTCADGSKIKREFSFQVGAQLVAANTVVAFVSHVNYFFKVSRHRSDQ
jgi:hypothetical protein